MSALTPELRSFLSYYLNCPTSEVFTCNDAIVDRNDDFEMTIDDAEFLMRQHTDDYNNYLDAQWLRLEQEADQACEDACNF